MNCVIGFLLLSATLSIVVGLPEGLKDKSHNETTTNISMPIEPIITSISNTSTTALPIKSSTITSTTPVTISTSTAQTTNSTNSTTTANPTKPSTSAPPTTPASSPSIPTSTPPTLSPLTSTHPTAVTTPLPIIPSKGHHFDGLSFMGGIILITCIFGISVASYKFYKMKVDPSYHIL